MGTFVLVHGAMHGGWCWGEVRRRLTARGHDVYTPTLTGQGDRHDELTPDVGITTHVRDLEELLWFEDLRVVTLVLHSYAGVLAGPLAESSADRLDTVVYLGAFVTAPGESLLDVEPPDVVERYHRQVAEEGEGWYLPATDAFLEQWGVADPALRAWVGPRLTDFPFRCQVEPTDFDPAPLARLRKVYVAHTDPPLASLQRFAEAAGAAGWETHALACGHDVMLAAPGETADLLGRIAAGP
jgi:pimeloyl-ACP methyl ester carboxylesterase